MQKNIRKITTSILTSIKWKTFGNVNYYREIVLVISPNKLASGLMLQAGYCTVSTVLSVCYACKGKKEN